MSLELTPQQREQLGRAALDWALQYFDEQSRLPIYPTTNPTALTALLASAHQGAQARAQATAEQQQSQQRYS